MRDAPRTGARALLAAVLALALPGSAGAVPLIMDPTLTPTSWSKSLTAAATWEQSGFSPPLAGPAFVQTRPFDGTDAPWVVRHAIPGPLVDGANGVVGMNVADLEGRHEVRVVIPGLAPAPLGLLRLDRTPPAAVDPLLPPTGGLISAEWTQADAGSGTDPAMPPLAEVNAEPAASAAGAWLPFVLQPQPGDGRRRAQTDASGLAEGRHLVRVTSRDLVGNAGVRVLGAVHVDRTAPAVAAPSEEPRSDPRQATVRLRADVDDGAGAGVVRITAAPEGAGPDVDWSGGGPGPDGVLTVATPGPGTHRVQVRAWDAAGNRGDGPAVAVRVLSDAELDDRRRAEAAPPDIGAPPTHPPAGEPGPAAGRPPNLGVRVAWSRARRFHRARAGVAVRGAPRVVRTPAVWRSLLGRRNAAQYAGYTTAAGAVLLGPAATAGLEALQRARLRHPRGRPPSRADLDRMVMGLAVVLHESIHAGGAPAPGDYHHSPSSRALEEGLTEAATADLLRRYVASLGLPRPLAVRMRVAVRRHRPAYIPQVRWVRHASAVATGGPVNGRAAVAWRVRAADRWGEERWDALAAVLGRGVRELRLGIPAIRGVT